MSSSISRQTKVDCIAQLCKACSTSLFFTQSPRPTFFVSLKVCINFCLHIYLKTNVVPGSSLLKQTNNSSALAVMLYFPDHHWKLWRFSRQPKKTMKIWVKSYAIKPEPDFLAETQLRLYLDDLAAQHRLASPRELSFLSKESLTSPVMETLNRFGGLESVIDHLYTQQSPQLPPHSHKRTLPEATDLYYH